MHFDKLISIEWLYIYLIIFNFIYWFLRERKRDIDLLLHLFMYSLVDSCMCPDQRPYLKPWHIEITFYPTELPSQGGMYTFNYSILTTYKHSHKVSMHNIGLLWLNFLLWIFFPLSKIFWNVPGVTILTVWSLRNAEAHRHHAMAALRFGLGLMIGREGEAKLSCVTIKAVTVDTTY